MIDVIKLQKLAWRIRKNVLEMTYSSGVNGGHIGGAFSAAEIFAVLYGQVLNIDITDPENNERDRFILSKGHTALAHYAVLAEIGLISKEEMMSFEMPGSAFPTHEVMNIRKGIEFSSGSLGYGPSLGVGTALMGKRLGKSYHTYVLMGDGECNEGSVWEAVMSSVQYKLDNLTFIIDVNNQQLDGYTRNIMPISNFEKVFSGFGCHVVSVDGNNIEELLRAFSNSERNKSTAIIAYTVKNKGIASIEGKEGYHHISLTEETYNQFKQEMGC